MSKLSTLLASYCISLFTLITGKKNYLTAFFIVFIMLLWVGSGLLLKWIKSEENLVGGLQHEVSRKPPLVSVKARYSKAHFIERAIQVRGRSEANRSVQLRAEVSGHIVAVPVAEGAMVEKGDVICQLAAEDRILRLDVALAEQDKAKLDYSGALKLKTGGYQSRTAIAAAKSVLNTAIANTRRRQLDIEHLQIRAPFDGVVDRRDMEVGDFMQRGAPCASLLELNPLVITGQVAEADVVQLVSGQKAQVVFLNGEMHQGILRFVGRSANNITRTFRIEVSIENSDWHLRSGMTANVAIATGQRAAHFISPALLILNDTGIVGLHILDAEDRVVFTPVELLEGDATGIWVQGLPETGLPENLRLITVGQHYVSVGEQVAVVLEGLDTKVNMKNKGAVSSSTVGLL